MTPSASKSDRRGTIASERALRREGADVQFVDHQVLAGNAVPGFVRPAVGGGKEHRRGPMHALRLPPRRDRASGRPAAVRQSERIPQAFLHRRSPLDEIAVPSGVMADSSRTALAESYQGDRIAERRPCPPETRPSRLANRALRRMLIPQSIGLSSCGCYLSITFRGIGQDTRLA